MQIKTAIIKDNKLVHFNTYGYANIETKKPLDNESIFRIFNIQGSRTERFSIVFK